MFWSMMARDQKRSMHYSECRKIMQIFSNHKIGDNFAPTLTDIQWQRKRWQGWDRDWKRTNTGQEAKIPKMTVAENVKLKLKLMTNVFFLVINRYYRRHWSLQTTLKDTIKLKLSKIMWINWGVFWYWLPSAPLSSLSIWQLSAKRWLSI